MEQNKIGKYLKYAIGEILLVVIGILIALYLNNLQLEKKKEAIRQSYYHQLLKDSNNDKIYIEHSISYIDSIINNYNAYLETYKEPYLDLNQVFDNQDNLNLNFYSLRFNTNTMESLVYTGDIKLISSTIRNNLDDLKKFQNRVIRSLDGNMKISKDILKLASLKSGGFTLQTRLSNQPKLSRLLKIEDKKGEIFVLLESYNEWVIQGNRRTLFYLKKMRSYEEVLINLITDELKK